MGLFDRLFGRKRGEQPPEEVPPPEVPAAEAPAPEPAEAAEEKRGFFSRLFGRKKKEAPPAEEAEAPPPQEAPPAPPAEGPPAGEGPPEEPPPKDYSGAPGSLRVRIPGVWKVSRRVWVGVVDGTLTGGQVVEFLKAIDEGRETDAVQMVCDAYGDDFGALVDLEESTWDGLVY
ncbi:hypothetical protein [Streptomyces sp. BRA346]|uniref:hypothetical protein n=1 Tax=Streptomyces sp. BRA346 TaxID=2878199 RepID=UPI004063DBC5